MWLARIGSSRVDASLVTLRCLLSVALSARCRFSPIIITKTAATHYPIHSFASQTSPTYRLSDRSRLQRASPSVLLIGQSQSVVTTDTRSSTPSFRTAIKFHQYNLPMLLSLLLIYLLSISAPLQPSLPTLAPDPRSLRGRHLFLS